MSRISLWVESAEGTGTEQSVEIERIANCGYTGRDEEEVRKHVEELAEEGVPAPETVPAVYPKPNHLITTADRIDVASGKTSGEAEFVLFPQGSEVYVGVGSDHTDRDLEREDVALSKTVCPNAVGDTAWRLSDVVDHWDEIELRSWTGEGRDPYQDATLDAILSPGDLISLVDERSTESIQGTAVFSGSVGTESGELVYGDTFAAELYDPKLDRTISVEYEVRELDWLA